MTTMFSPFDFESADKAWASLAKALVFDGSTYSPNGFGTREILGANLSIPLTRPVITPAVRKLSYRGMAAEALWICTGSDSLDELSPWLPAYEKFSDDGEILFGAYGPRFREQLDHVVSQLLRDPWSRRAVMTLWRPNPPTSTKDTPCTLTLTFQIRREAKHGLAKYVLHTHVHMRSSDAFLGIPYDWFSFSCMSALVAARVNAGLGFTVDHVHGGARTTAPRYSDGVLNTLYRTGEGMQIGWDANGSGGAARVPVGLGRLYWSAASSHLYERDIARTTETMHAIDMGETRDVEEMPTGLYAGGTRGEELLLGSLLAVRGETVSGDDFHSGSAPNHTQIGETKVDRRIGLAWDFVPTS